MTVFNLDTVASSGGIKAESAEVGETGSMYSKTRRTRVYLVVAILVAVSVFFVFGLQQKQAQLMHTSPTIPPHFTNVTAAYLLSLVKSYNMTDIPNAVRVYNTSVINYAQNDNVTMAQNPFSGCTGNTSIKSYVQGTTNVSSPVFDNTSMIDASVPIKEYLRTSFLNGSTYPYYLKRYVGDGGICDYPVRWIYVISNSTYFSKPIKVVGGSPAYLVEFSNLSKPTVDRLGISYSGNSSDLVIYIASAFYMNIYVASMSLWASPKYANPNASIIILNRTLSQIISRNTS